MPIQTVDGIDPAVLPPIELLPKERRILDRPFMAFRPFGLD